MSSERATTSFNPQSNAFKNILKTPKEEKRSFGKEEFLARRKFFLEKLENEGGIPKPKPFVSKSPAAAKKKASNEKLKTSINNIINPVPSAKNIKNIKSTQCNNISDMKNIEKDKISLSTHDWSISSAKSESLRKIIDLANKGETNTVGKSVFSARQKFFADSQLSNVDQLMPRPSTPPGYCYYERCPSPSIESSKRRYSYSLHSSSQSISNSTINYSSPKPVSPSISVSSYNKFPWEHDNKKKEIVQPKPQTQVNVIKFLEKHSFVSECPIELPEPITFKKEILSIDEPKIIKIEKVETSKPMISKILESFPEPIHFYREALPIDKSLSIYIINIENIEPQLPKYIFIQEKLPESVKFEKELLLDDEPMEIITEYISMPKMNIPEIIQLLPEPVNVTRKVLPQDELISIITETIHADEKHFSQIITALPEAVRFNNELLPQDEPLEIKTENVIAEEKQIPVNIKMVVKEIFNEKNDFKSNLFKTIDISSLTLESNIEEKKEYKKNNKDNIINNNYSSEIQPFIEIGTPKNNQSLPDFDIENVYNSNKEGSLSSNSSINEFLNNNGTLFLDEPLPRKSIPIYNNNEEQLDNLIDLSENNITDKVRNWYNVVDNAINDESDLNLKEKM